MKGTDFDFKFELLRAEYGDFWHICTRGSDVQAFNESEDDYRFAVSNVAVSAYESGATVMVDEIMKTHLHVIAAGSKQKCISFVDCFRYREERYHNSHGRFYDLSGLSCSEPIPITDIQMFRSEVCYVARNAYVSDERYLPFSYPWGSASYLFNPLLKVDNGISFGDAPYQVRRSICRRRSLQLPQNYRYKDGMIFPPSYARLDVVESLFFSPHHYFNMVSKNWEAYSEEAKRLGDNSFLTYDELMSVARQLGNDHFNMKNPSMLAPNSKVVIARMLHSQYGASNNQIRSILKMPQETVDELFPLKAK